MSTTEQQQLDDETCLALGRFVVEFSRLLAAIETATLRLAGGLKGITNPMLRALIADRTAGPIVSSLVAVFSAHWQEALTKEDKDILKQLRVELTDIVEIRNRLMHDVWMSKTVGGMPGPFEFAKVRARASAEGFSFKIEEVGPAKLSDLVSDAKRLAGVVNGLVWVENGLPGGPNLASKISLANPKKVARLGSRAHA